MAPTTQQPTRPEDSPEAILPARPAGAAADEAAPAQPGFLRQEAAAPDVAASVSSASPATPTTTTAPAAGAGSSVERMARLRQLVRKEGMDPEAASHEVGVDPIIAQLWLRLPDDLWPTPEPVAGTPVPALSPLIQDVPTTGTGYGPASAPGSSASGLRRVLTCRIPSPAYDRLRVSEASGSGRLETALQALESGLALPLPEVAAGGWRFPRRPLALPLPAASYTAVLRLAQEHFDNDPREAAGWLIARGLGMALPLPTAEELAGLPSALGSAALGRPAASPLGVAPPIARFVLPPRRRPELRAPLPADDSAPSGEELRSRREAIGISQRDLAAASGLSRGLVAEVERGRRRHVLTRLKLAETLASLARASGKQMAVAQ